MKSNGDRYKTAPLGMKKKGGTMRRPMKCIRSGIQNLIPQGEK